jgi:tetratricopeptide (TPR) repeat protein
MTRLAIASALTIALAGCSGQPPAEPAAQAPAAAPAAARPEATSLLGAPLVPIALPNRDALEENLRQAEAELAAHPDSADALIWVGRRQGYLWEYRAAIETFGKGIAQFPADARFYRHRGHRYITLRMFDEAIADLEKATTLIAGTPDEIEPDGQPNAQNTPRSTLQSNIWYHLGLAYYLKADYANARRAYEACLEVSDNDDMLVATSDWLWMTLERLEADAAAAHVLERITPGMDIIENDAYHKRLLMYKGMVTPGSLLDTTSADDLTIATQGYGVGNYYSVTGDEAKARGIFERVIDGSYWAAFGYIAAEADLARMR